MKDFLIVGFGLAGLSVARHLDMIGVDFDIISNQSQKSSRIAGGILNPVAVKHMKPVWRVEEFLPYAKQYYQDFEHELNVNIYNDKALQVFIHDIVQENNWFEAYDRKRLKPFVNPDLINNTNKLIKSKKLGVINASWIDLKPLFHSAEQSYIDKEVWKNEKFDYSALDINQNEVHYGKQSYEHIVFCEGFGVTKNPFFKDLGIYGNKGDYLIFKSKSLKLNSILKAKYFLIPLGDDLYKFGATYQREPLNHQPSEDARVQLIEALHKMIDASYEVVDQVCGIRPTTRDRKPILGTHQTYGNLHILNGFGSRGVMTSPLLGKKLVNHIVNQKPIDEDVSINRFYAQT